MHSSRQRTHQAFGSIVSQSYKYMIKHAKFSLLLAVLNTVPLRVLSTLSLPLILLPSGVISQLLQLLWAM